jgi:hypothetical protein
MRRHRSAHSSPFFFTTLMKLVSLCADAMTMVSTSVLCAVATVNHTLAARVHTFAQRVPLLKPFTASLTSLIQIHQMMMRMSFRNVVLHRVLSPLRLRSCMTELSVSSTTTLALFDAYQTLSSLLDW